MEKSELVAAVNCSVTGRVVNSLLPFNPFRSRFSVTLQFSTIIFWSVPFTVWLFGLLCFWAAVVPPFASDQAKSNNNGNMKRVTIAFDIGGFLWLRGKVRS